MGCGGFAREKATAADGQRRGETRCYAVEAARRGVSAWCERWERRALVSDGSMRRDDRKTTDTADAESARMAIETTLDADSSCVSTHCTRGLRQQTFCCQPVMETRSESLLWS
jgi:hypothetical protein